MKVKVAKYDEEDEGLESEDEDEVDYAYDSRDEADTESSDDSPKFEYAALNSYKDLF